jgi:hexosaminidase
MKFKILPLFISFLFIHILATKSQDLNIIPKPQEFSFDKSSLVIDENTLIISLKESEKSAEKLQNYFKEAYNLNIKSTEFQSLKKKAIHFKMDENLTNEGYELSISEDGITICALDDQGWFYAVQSLIQYCSSNSYFSKYEKSIKLKGVKK